MKVVDVALKDLLRFSRSAFLLVFALVLPLATLTIFYFAFGGTGDGGGFEMPTTEVIVVNQDRAVAGAEGLPAGQMLVEFMQHESLAVLVAVREMDDPDRARQAVDEQSAAVAVIIPPNLSAALVDPDGRAVVTIYQDPTLTLGPSIVKGIVGQFVDGFAGSKIATAVARAQHNRHGVTVSDAATLEVAMAYASWAEEQGASLAGNSDALLDVQSVADELEARASGTTRTITVIMAGMLVYYAFFTSASAAQSLLKEEEENTLPRLFTTPTPHSTVLSGKFLAIFVTVVLQVIVLVWTSVLIFGLAWGQFVPVALAGLGQVALAASFGIFVTSLLRDTKQAGFVYGVVMNVLGWVGISRMFVGTVPGTQRIEGIANLLSLIAPQGWTMWAWEAALNGRGVGRVAAIVSAVLVMSAVFLAIGTLRFKRRFA